MSTDVPNVKRNCRSMAVREGAARTLDVTPLSTCGLPHSKPRKANECLAEARRLKPPAELFDQFWREGELALFFGASGIGKSVLAVQIADALARGTPLHGFVMPKGRRKVLYVDLSLSDPQFHARYGRYKFAENLYREAPPDGADLCDWIKRMVEENGFRVVIVDDLSAIKRTHDGIREMLACMRRLKRFRDKLGISILVLSDAFEPTGQQVSENDLKRSRVLCTAADSVFAIGRKRPPEGGRCIVQTRHRSAEVFWNMRNAPVGEIRRLESGLLGFEFDERFTPEMDEDKRRLICEVARLQEVEGRTFRDIGQQLGISKSWACELYKRWTPAMDEETRDEKQGDESLEPDEDDGWRPREEAYPGEHTDDYMESIGLSRVWQKKWEAEQRLLSVPPAVAAGDLNGSPPYEGGVAGVSPDGVVLSEVEEEIGTTENSEYTEEDTEFTTHHSQLTVRIDGYGREIFVESELPNGKPLVWYHFDKKGNKIRCERSMFGITTERVNSPPFL